MTYTHKPWPSLLLKEMRVRRTWATVLNASDRSSERDEGFSTLVHSLNLATRKPLMTSAKEGTCSLFWDVLFCFEKHFFSDFKGIHADHKKDENRNHS